MLTKTNDLHYEIKLKIEKKISGISYTLSSYANIMYGAFVFAILRFVL